MKLKPKTLLILPSLSGRLESHVNMITEPLGLAYIAAVLEENNYEVNILDTVALGNEQIEKLGNGMVRVGLTEQQIKEHIGSYAPDIIGVSCIFSAQEMDHLRIARFAKEVCPEAVVVCGGAHATVSPESLLRDKNVDLVVKGEGEITFLELVKSVEAGDNYAHLAGTITKNEDGSILYNPTREAIADLDTLPFPARHLLPMEKYFESQKKGRVLYRYYMRKPIANIVTSRGCPFDCVFCAVQTVWGRTWRGRSTKNLVDEIKFLVKEYGIREFSAWDDNIGIDRKRLINICDGITEADLDLKWSTPNGIYLWRLDEEVLTKMKKSGYYRANFGIESGDPKTLKLIGKSADFDKVKRILRICDRFGIWTYASFIIGFPDEGLESINKTINASTELGVDFASIFIAQPYMGTKLRAIFEKEGLLKPGEQRVSSEIMSSGYDTKYFTGKELGELQQAAYKKLLRRRIARAINPMNIGQIIFKINSPENFLYFLRLVLNLASGVWMGKAASPAISERINSGILAIRNCFVRKKYKKW